MGRIIDTSDDSRYRFKRIDCKICDGTGIDRTNSIIGEPCQTCGAKGTRWFPAGPSQKCPVCQGHGKDIRFSALGTPCRNCDAFGEIPV